LEQRERQAAQVAAAKQQARGRARILAAVGVVALALAGFGGWRAYQAQQEELVYELEDVYMVPRDGMIAHREVERIEPGAPEAESRPTVKRPRNPTLPTGGGEQVATAPVSGSGEGGSVKFVAAGSSGTGDVAIGISGASGGRSALGDVEIAVHRVDSTVLQTDEEIKAMAKEVSSAYYPQVESCVQRRLKADPTFQGGWKVKFTIETDGTVSGFSSTALDQPDSELESCMQRTISAWRFQRIAHSFKVGKTYRFAAGS
jgi:hypothetical protein